MVNRAVEKLFKLSEGETLGHAFIEVVRDHELDSIL
jgi:hypothetical protein